MAPLRFHVVDYVVFGITLLFSMAIGMYHGFTRKQSTTKDFLLASRRMMSIPVALSLLASFMSGVTILGVPSEIYKFGIQYGLIVLSYTVLIPLVSLVFIPILYGLNLTSSYEYLERRFSVGVRMIGTSLFILYTLLYMSIATYGPSLALQSVTGLPIWVSILSLGIVCTFYTSIGGIRAVIWNDVFQAVVMVGGLISVVIVGTLKVGSPSRVIELLKENNRTDISFSFDPTERTTVWALVIGGAFGLLPLWSVNQTAVQRYISAKTLRDAQKTVWYGMSMAVIAVTLCTICGCVIFAYYQGCDPTLLKKISSSDQILPYFVLDAIGRLHGLPGLFLACLFSGTLSTVSSGLNSLAAVCLEDFVIPTTTSRSYDLSEKKLTQLSKVVGLPCLNNGLSIYLSWYCTRLANSETETTHSRWSRDRTTKISIAWPALNGLFPFPIWPIRCSTNLASRIVTPALFGLVTVGLSFLAGSLGTIVQSFVQISGVTGGPVVAVFSIGMLTRRANKKGAYVGVLCGISFGFFFAIGARINKPPTFVPHASTERCQASNVSLSTSNSKRTKQYDGLSLYKMSPFWSSFYCYFITFFVGLLVSFLWKEEDQSIDERLLFKWKREVPAIFIGITHPNSDNENEKINLGENLLGTNKETCNEDKQTMNGSLVSANATPLVESKTDF